MALQHTTTTGSSVDNLPSRMPEQTFNTLLDDVIMALNNFPVDRRQPPDKEKSTANIPAHGTPPTPAPTTPPSRMSHQTLKDTIDTVTDKLANWHISVPNTEHPSFTMRIRNAFNIPKISTAAHRPSEMSQNSFTTEFNALIMSFLSWTIIPYPAAPSASAQSNTFGMHMLSARYPKPSISPPKLSSNANVQQKRTRDMTEMHMGIVERELKRSKFEHPSSGSHSSSDDDDMRDGSPDEESDSCSIASAASTASSSSNLLSGTSSSPMGSFTTPQTSPPASPASPATISAFTDRNGDTTMYNFAIPMGAWYKRKSLSDNDCDSDGDGSSVAPTSAKRVKVFSFRHIRQ